MRLGMQRSRETEVEECASSHKVGGDQKGLPRAAQSFQESGILIPGAGFVILLYSLCI
jgi:hypothetical protein